MNPPRTPSDQLTQDCQARFKAMVEATGTKKFATCLEVTTRQVNRMLAGTQPNPVERLIRCIQSAPPDIGDQVVDFVCQELGGHFVREETINSAAVNAVRECAEAIAAISDGQVQEMDMKEIREAISALSSLIHSLQQKRNK